MFRKISLFMAIALIVAGCAAKKPPVSAAGPTKFRLVEKGIEGGGTTKPIAMGIQSEFSEADTNGRFNSFTLLASWIGFEWLASRLNSCHGCGTVSAGRR